MALFGGIGKKLGLGSARDTFGDSLGGLVEGVGDTINEALPTIGAAVGFAMGGPQGAAIGSGLGTFAQGGNSTEDILINSALAFGAGSVAQGFGIQPSTQTSGIGQFIPDTSGFSAFGMGPGAEAAATIPDELAFSQGTSGLAGTDAAGGGIADFFSGMDAGDYLLAGSLGLGALGALGGLGEGEGEAVPDRPQPKGEAFGTVQDRDGKVYEIADPVQLAEYNKKLQEYQNPDFRYDTDRVVVRANEGGIMNMAHGGSFDEAVDGEVQGPGTGTSDSVPAKLSDGEFVLTAKSVRGAGGGDRDIGAARLYDMMAELEATA
jgi:hypothetical protein|tara:strand:+ start:1170 stop:2129 length:960 start_codon:yes stop_codon:yes gene_type:complete